MSEIKLLPCPFCGGEAKTDEYHTDNGAPEHWYREYDSYFVECKECGAIIVSCISMESAIKKWNHRKPIADMVEQLTERMEEVADYVDDDIFLGEHEAYKAAIAIVRGGRE